MVLAALAAAGCASDEAADPVDTPACNAIEDVAIAGAAVNRALAGDWETAASTLRDRIAATDDAYRDLVAADEPGVSSAAEDLLAYDEAVLASGALDAPSLEEFRSTVASLPGSAEAGAADEVLKVYARETCGVAPPE